MGRVEFWRHHGHPHDHQQAWDDCPGSEYGPLRTIRPFVGARLATLVPVETRPVFADLSGRRRRLMRRLGIGSGAALVICLGAVMVALAGGPQAPFTHWAAPPSAADQAANARAGHDRSGTGSGANTSPTSSGRSGSSGSAATPSRSASSPHPSPSPTKSASPTPSASPSPPSSAHTPPGHTKSPNPHRSSHTP